MRETYSRKSKKILIVLVQCGRKLCASLAMRRYISAKRIYLCYHYEPMHKGKFGHLADKLREDEINLLKLDLQHDVFTVHNKFSEAASFFLLQIIAE
jgi:hypothetical protein